ncbi:MAG: DUF6391 domain-containing protein [Leptolyngbyaceae cyanobacterium]
MTYATAYSSEPWGWGAEVINGLLAGQPQPTQDAELLNQLGFLPGFKQLLMLRQVHALEHATVWMLSNRRQVSGRAGLPPLDNELLGGMSTEHGFYLYGQVQLNDLKRAVQVALRRITSGEWELAVHPRCGTNLSVGMAVTAGLAVGFSWLFPRSPISQLIGFSAASVLAAQVTPDLGMLAQRYVTTSIPFNLEIEQITRTCDPLGRSAYFVQVRWVENGV